MKKAFLVLFIAIPPLLFFSCSKKNIGKADKKAYLKDRARILESRLDWSVDVSVVDGAFPFSAGVSPSLVQLPLAHIAAFNIEQVQATYPYLEGFGSLDTRAYSDAAISTLEGFCKSLEEDRSSDSFFDKGFLYSLTLFKYNLSSMHRFQAEGKSSGLGVLKLMSEKESSDGIGKKNSRAKADAKISSHLIARPFMPQGKDGVLQCPVRLFFTDDSFCDIYVYLVKSASDWKINQIEFMKNDEEKRHEGN